MNRLESLSLGLFLMLGFITSILPSTCLAQRQRAFSFDFTDGANPQGDLISDAAGNLYGTTTYGGTGICKNNNNMNVGCGTVFEMIPPPSPSAQWSQKVLHDFDLSNEAVGFPVGSLAFDSVGDLYGVSQGGGLYEGGTAFELSPQPGGSWALTLLYAFGASGDGFPNSGLLIDQSGNLYGTSLGGNGRVFELYQFQGRWFENFLYVFQGLQDGAAPTDIVFDASGNIYGTTSETTVFGKGTVFKLSPPAEQGQAWTETTLHTFGLTFGDGSQPMAGVVLGPNGTLVGTTVAGGIAQGGTVYALAPPAVVGGQWGYKVLANFGTVLGDGIAPVSKLMLITSKAGTVGYGTTSAGGLSNAGTVFEVEQSTPGSWAETPVYSFTGGRDGATPMAGLLLQGYALYGTTAMGGIENNGTVFRLTH